jgi:hypothetical protein
MAKPKNKVKTPTGYMWHPSTVEAVNAFSDKYGNARQDLAEAAVWFFYVKKGVGDQLILETLGEMMAAHDRIKREKLNQQKPDAAGAQDRVLGATPPTPPSENTSRRRRGAA